VPNFRIKPAKIIEPGVGASTCASGNQIWKGIIGIFVEKPKNKKIHIKKSRNNKELEYRLKSKREDPLL